MSMTSSDGSAGDITVLPSRSRLGDFLLAHGGTRWLVPALLACLDAPRSGPPSSRSWWQRSASSPQALPGPTPGTTTLGALADSGAPPENGAGFASISGDGSAIVFGSFGSDVDVDGPTGAKLFLRDRSTSTTEAVDVPPAGVTFGNVGGPEQYDVSDDGRYVVFDHLQPGTCSNADLRECREVYRRDLLLNTTELVSVATDGTTPANQDSFDPEISADGERVVFSSYATDIVADELPAFSNVYMRDFVTGVTEVVSVSSDGAPASQESWDPTISADGRTVAFVSDATNLGSNPSTSADVFVRALDAGTTAAALPGSYAFGSFQPTLSADGGAVAFGSRADVRGTGESTSRTRVYAIDETNTISTPTTHAFDGEQEPQLSDDGRHVAYRTSGPQSQQGQGVFVWDRATGATEVESVRSDGSFMQSQMGPQPMSGDGRFIVFDTLEETYPGDEPDATLDVVVHDRAEETQTATGTGSVSTGSPGGPTYEDALHASVSGSPGEVTITELTTRDGDAQPIDGYSVLGQQVRITAAPATPPSFLTFTFDLDRSMVPASAAPGDVDLFRNGVALPLCASAADFGPCVASRTVLASGDWRFVAHSPEASVWAIAIDETFTPGPTDTAPPTITLTSPVQSAKYVVGQDVTASYECSDTQSGIATCTGTRANGASIDTSSIGTKTFTVNAADNAGNSASTTVTYRVVWPVRGFFPPVDNPPVVNTVKAGAVVPARFALGGYRGTRVFASGYPRTQSVACPRQTPADEVEQTLPRSAASLTYRRGVYTYAWRSDRSWASRSTCRKLVVRFKDGQRLTALFRLR